MGRMRVRRILPLLLAAALVLGALGAWLRARAPQTAFVLERESYTSAELEAWRKDRTVRADSALPVTSAEATSQSLALPEEEALGPSRQVGFTVVPAPPLDPRYREQTAPTLPVLFHVSDADREHLGTAWFAEQITVANRVFEPVGLSFESVGVVAMGDEPVHLDNRADRHALGSLLRTRLINCFVVRSMRDVDNPEEMRRGVHWRTETDAHFVVLTSIGPRTTLAHELGHFFGNREHSTIAGNIMSYTHGELPWFDEVQAKRIRRFARRFLRSGELVPFDRLIASQRRLAHLMRPHRRRPRFSLERPVVPARGRAVRRERATYVR